MSVSDVTAINMIKWLQDQVSIDNFDNLMDLVLGDYIEGAPSHIFQSEITSFIIMT